MRIEEYEIKHLCNDLKQIMRDIGQSSAVAISGLLAERLYEMGYRRQDEITAINERGYNLGLVDGAKQFIKQLQTKCTGNTGYEYSFGNLVGLINEILEEELTK